MMRMRTTMIFSLLAIFAIGLPLGANAQENAAHSINVMSFNLRYNTPNDGANAWPERKELVATTIFFHRADLLGVQEALHEQMLDMQQTLTEFKWVGVGRDDGKTQGEYSAIFYRHARFEMIEHGNFWLSETPEQVGSVGWDAAITRIVTWARFKDKRSGKTFLFCNTHFDHMGQKAREESAKLLRARSAALARNVPIIITGDFNANEASLVYQTMIAPPEKDQRIMKNARALSALPHVGPAWTFHGFGKATERPWIDYIFVSEGVRVLRHAALYEYGEERYPSDHLAVFAELELH